MTYSDESAHQRTLLAIHLRRLMVIDENRAQRPEDVNQRLDHERTVAEINGCALNLGLGNYPEQAAAIVEAAGLRAQFTASLRKQRQRLGAYRKVLELRYAEANAMEKVDLGLALDQADELLGTLDRQLEAFGASSSGAPLPAPSLPSPLGLDPDQARRLRDLLRRCDEYFDANRKLRALFVDQRLGPWRDGLPEAENLNARVDRVIDYLRDKRNTARQRALVLLLQVLAERYDAGDARHDELLALAQEL